MEERFVKRIISVALLALIGSLTSAVVGINISHATPASLTETFTTDTLINPSKWVASTTGTSGVHPCLTARPASSAAIALGSGTSIPGCEGTSDSNGSGALILTTAAGNQTATMLYNSALPTAGGIDVSFYQAQYGGDNADGISFFVQNGSVNNLTTGIAGGGLGYKGLPGGLFGVGFDKYGNWLNTSGSWDSACSNPGQTAYAIAVRGPDKSAGLTGANGYCVLPGSNGGPSSIVNQALFGSNSSTRATAARPTRIIVDPSTDTNPKIRVYVWSSGNLSQDIATATNTLIVDQPAEYKSATSFKFGFSASTGGATDIHAIWGLSIAPTTAVVSPTIYAKPSNLSIQSGSATPNYPVLIYSDAAFTTPVLIGNLSNYTAPTCTSTYTQTTPAGTLAITCSGGGAALYNLDTSATGTLTITRGTPSISPTSRTITGKVGSAITPTSSLTATNFLGAVTYSISPALPVGLVMDTSTGVISGTPTETATSKIFVITGVNGSDSANSDVTITIAAQPILAPTTLSISGRVTEAIVATAGFTATNFSGAVTYTATTPLPAGLNISPTTGVISGTPTVASAAQDYTITASDGTNSLTAKVTITIVNFPSISPAVQSIVAKVGTAITSSTPYVPSNFTGTVTYSISPALPAGLTFSTFTGVISGTPTVAVATVNETVTATDGTNTATARITISSRLVPLISPAGSVISGIVNTIIAPSPTMEAKYFTGTPTYSISPALPVGLILNSQTGVVTGTPTTIQGLSTYTLSASDGVDTATSTIQISVVASQITYSVTYLPNSGTGTMVTDSGSGTTFKLTPNAYTRTGYSFTGWKDAAGISYSDGQNLTFTSNTSLQLTAQWSAISVNNNNSAGQPDVITSMDPGSGIVGTKIVITGKFSRTITDITFAGTSLAKGSWSQTPTTVTFNSPAAAVGSLSKIQLLNGATPLLSELSFLTISAELPPPAPLISFPTYLISDGVVGYDGVKLILAFEFAKAKTTKSHIAALKKYMVKLNKTVTIVGYAQAIGKKPDLKFANLRAKAITASIKKLYPKAKITWKASAVKKSKECGAFSNKCVVVVAK